MERTRKLEGKAWTIVKLYLLHFFSEMIGTAIVIFVGCMGFCRGLEENEKLGTVLAYGMAVFMGIQFAAHNSGGHINPAVTVLSLFFRRISFQMAVMHIFAQLVGGIIGFGFLKAVIPSDIINFDYEDFGVCTTIPHKNVSIVQAILLEFLITSILILIICSAWDPRNLQYDYVNLKLGFAVFALSYVAAPYTGASMNPARSFAPALWNHSWKHHWVYWVGPLGASTFWGLVYTRFLCPRPRKEAPPAPEPTQEVPAEDA